VERAPLPVRTGRGRRKSRSAWLKLREIRHSRFGPRLRSLPAKSNPETIMALQLRPNCEYCDKDLPPSATDARICSYECTFCADCVETKLGNVCPNCGGGFAPRPIRPAKEWRSGVCTARHPPSDKRVHLKYSLEDIAAHSARLKSIAPQDR
jgi:hypothetical protein